MAKGQQSKADLTKELLNYFGDRAFLYNDGKEIRVKCKEEGEEIQVKITLTAAKVSVTPGGDVALPGADSNAPIAIPVKQQAIPTPSEQEKQNIKTLLETLGL